MVSYDELCKIGDRIAYEVEYKIGYELGRILALEVYTRREAFPHETYEETAEAVGCSVEDVLEVVNHTSRWGKKRDGRTDS